MIPGFYPANLDTTPISGTQYFSGTIRLIAPVVDYLSTPPGGPALNSRYIVAPAGLLAWLGHDNQIATWTGAAWSFTIPGNRDAAYDTTNDVIRTFNNTAWELITATYTNYNGRTALINLDVTGGTVVVTLGSYDPTQALGARFTAEKILTTVTAGANPTIEDWPLAMIPTNKAIEVALSAGTAYIRTQGKVAEVVG
jgi:hypothetical protein